MSREPQELDFDLEEIIRILGSIVSCPQLKTLSEVLEEFKNVTGTDVPIRKFKHNDICTFIKELCSENIELLGSDVDPIVVLKDRKIVIKTEPESTQNAEEQGSVYGQNIKREKNSRSKKDPFRNVTIRPRRQKKKLGIKRLQRVELKRRIRELITENPNGLYPEELMAAYRDRYGCEINYTALDFSSVEEAASTAHNVVVIHQSDGKLLIREKVSDDELDDEEIYPRPESPLSSEEDALPGVPYDIERVYPEDCLNLTERVEDNAWWKVKCDSLIPVFVTEIYSPSHFWINILDRNLNRKHTQMIKDLNRYFYDGEGRGRRLAIPAWQVGQYCVLKVDKVNRSEWVRAVIVQRVDSDTVKVRMVDYGCIKEVPGMELLPLPKCFASMRSQAIRARLAGVRPSGGASRWPIPFTVFFQNCIKSFKMLAASIVNIDRKEESLEVVLVKPECGNDFCVNDRMKLIGYADPLPGSSVESKETYLLPRFEVLESGETLDFSEMLKMSREGIDLNTIEKFRRHVTRQLQQQELCFKSMTGLEKMQQVVQNLPEAAVRSFTVIAVAHPTAAQKYLTELISTPSPSNE